jgi:hypothetical protein
MRFAVLTFSGAINLTKSFHLDRLKLRIEDQFFNLFNHPNFALPSDVFAGIPGKPSPQIGFGALTYTTSPPTAPARCRRCRRCRLRHCIPSKKE